MGSGAVRREDVDRGQTEIAAPDGRVIGAFTLSVDGRRAAGRPPYYARRDASDAA